MITSEIHLATVESTMETAKNLAGSQDFLLAWADCQTRGKGTRGRPWQSMDGNVYMTMGINRRHLPSPRLSLLPLEIGLHLWEEAAAQISPALRGELTLKWPNDLLVRGGKAGGILMESYGDFLLIGIGINVANAPEVADGGTPSACLADVGMAIEARQSLVEGIYQRVREAPRDEQGYEPETTLLQWQGKVDWKRAHRMRDRPDTPLVLPVAVNRHGHLQVQHADGAREWLVSEYLS